MKKLLAFCLIFMSLWVCLVEADEKIGGTLQNVDLLIEDLYNEDGHNHGERYYAINRNPYPMRISIALTEEENIENNLIDYTAIVEPRRRVDLGYVLQADLSKSSNWKYEWKAQQDGSKDETKE